jgi:hypothetical protein
LLLSPLQYLDSIQLNFKLGSWRNLPEELLRGTRSESSKSIIREILNQERVNRIFKFMASLSDTSLAFQIFLNNSMYFDGHIMTPGFLNYVTKGQGSSQEDQENDLGNAKAYDEEEYVEMPQY